MFQSATFFSRHALSYEHILIYKLRYEQNLNTILIILGANFYFGIGWLFQRELSITCSQRHNSLDKVV